MRSRKYNLVKKQCISSGSKISNRKGLIRYYSNLSLSKKMILIVSLVLIVTTIIVSAKGALDVRRVQAFINEKQHLEDTNYIDSGCKDIVFLYTGSGAARSAENEQIKNMILFHFGGKSKEGEISTNIVSLMADVYVRKGDSESFGSLKETYTNHSGKKLMTTINNFTDLNVKYYATFSDETIINLVDVLNSVELSIGKEDISEINKEQHKLVKKYGGVYTPIKKPGDQLVNGLQVAAYCEISTGENGSVSRDRHLRSAIKRIVSGLRHCSTADMEKARRVILNACRTNIDDDYCIKAGARLQKYAIGKRGRWPLYYERHSYNGSKYVFMNTLIENDNYLHKDLFLEQSYKPSLEVKIQSSYITKMIKKIKAEIAAAKKKAAEAAKEAAAKKKAEEEKKAQEEKNKNNTNNNNNTDNNNSNSNGSGSNKNNKDDGGNIDDGGNTDNGGGSDDNGDISDF